jgi:hypothetical protein
LGDFLSAFLCGMHGWWQIPRINKTKKLESKIQSGYYPTLAVMSSSNVSFQDITNFLLLKKELPSEAKDDPDRYLLPLDIVSRPIKGLPNPHHFANYLVYKWVVHLTGKEEGTKFDT